MLLGLVQGGPDRCGNLIGGRWDVVEVVPQPVQDHLKAARLQNVGASTLLGIRHARSLRARARLAMISWQTRGG
jgi:hypothetical protein